MRSIQEYGFNDLAGCVVQRRCRSTGFLVGLYHAEQAGMDPEAGRWVTVCEEHSGCVNHDSLAQARAWLTKPQDWCEPCGESARRRGGEPRP